MERTYINARTDDDKLASKVAAVQRGAFMEKFPNQCEHILRLITERLQLGLDKRDGTDPAVPETWKLNSTEIVNLAEAMYYINHIRLSIK